MAYSETLENESRSELRLEWIAELRVHRIVRAVREPQPAERDIRRHQRACRGTDSRSVLQVARIPRGRTDHDVIEVRQVEHFHRKLQLVAVREFEDLQHPHIHVLKMLVAEIIPRKRHAWSSVSAV